MSGELGVEQLRARFDQRVVPYLEGYRVQASGSQSQPPVVVYVGGQPGAGKSRANERAAQERPSPACHLIECITEFVRPAR